MTVVESCVLNVCNKPLGLSGRYVEFSIAAMYVQTLLYLFLAHLWECFHTRGL